MLQVDKLAIEELNLDAITGPIGIDSKQKIAISSDEKQPLVLADIYREEVNIVNWQRELPASLKESINNFIRLNKSCKYRLTVTPQNVKSQLIKEFGSTHFSRLIDDIEELVETFCYLFELSSTGLRLSILEQAMCPKFHVDRVPCRLVTTYYGIGTQWLPHHLVDRTKLGLGSKGLPDNESGLYQHKNDIQQIKSGDVALLKGETWYNNENAGLVHRSPELSSDEKRLLLTLDFAD